MTDFKTLHAKRAAVLGLLCLLCSSLALDAASAQKRRAASDKVNVRAKGRRAVVVRRFHGREEAAPEVGKLKRRSEEVNYRDMD